MQSKSYSQTYFFFNFLFLFMAAIENIKTSKGKKEVISGGESKRERIIERHLQGRKRRIKISLCKSGWNFFKKCQLGNE